MRVLRGTALGVGWLCTTAVALALVVRWRDVSSPLMIAAAGLTPFAALPLSAAGVSALLARSRPLQIGAALVAGMYLLTVTPHDALVGCGPSDADADVTVLTANVLWTTLDVDGVVAMIEESDADVVVLQEVSGRFGDRLLAHEGLAAYDYRSRDHDAGSVSGRAFSTMLLSRLDLVDTEPLDLGAQGATTATFETAAGTFTVSSIHLAAPFRSEFVPRWRNQLAALATMNTTEPAILAGDFNATTDHRPFRTLLDSGWTDAHEQKGCGLDLTYPVDGSLPFPVLRLDHVLVTDHFEVLRVDVLDDTIGSDHAPVLTAVRFRS